MKEFNEPWSLDGYHDIIDCTNKLCLKSTYNPHSKDYSNRAIDCVNACEGIGREYLQAFSLSKIIDDYQKVSKDKEELLLALEELVEGYENTIWNATSNSDTKKARSILERFKND